MTLSEILVVVAIVGLLVLLAAQSLKPNVQMAKARDARRVSDLKVISTSLEDYLGDHPCYPDESLMTCDPGDGLRPYLGKIPCDPQTKESYTYTRPDSCSQFVIYANLEAKEEMTYGAYNYALSSSNVRVLPTIYPTQTPAPSGPTEVPPEPTQTPSEPTPTPDLAGFYGCFSGVCESLGGRNCNPKYDRADCREQCFFGGEIRNECR